MLIYLHNIFEFISLLVAIIYYRYLKVNYMKWFLPFLAFVFFGELMAMYQGRILNESPIAVNYSIAVVESIFYGYIFYQLSHRLLLKKSIQFIVPISIFYYLGPYFFYKSKLSYFALNLAITGFFIAAIALAYLYEKFSDDDDETLLATEPGFWIAAGVILFYSGVSITFSLYDFIVKKELRFFGVMLYNLVPRVLSMILYTCISISIILCKKKNKI